jgi:membrane protein YqaA with SNARE-associated domain
MIVVVTCLTIGLSVFLIYNHEYVAKLEKHGYLGLFLISLVAGSPLPVPTPSMILTFTLGSILNPVFIGLVAGLGNTIGNGLIYYAGRSGRNVFSDSGSTGTKLDRFLNNKRITKVVNSKSWKEMAMVFLLFVYPNPLGTPLLLAMGAAHFSIPRFVITCWAGKTAQGLIFAYLGHFGLRSLLHLFGVFNA